MSDLYTPTGLTPAEAAAHLGRLHAVDQHDPETVSQPTLAAVAVVLAERDDYRTFRELVRRMRKAQSDFFRKRGDLSAAKALESRVDTLLRGLDP